MNYFFSIALGSHGYYIIIYKTISFQPMSSFGSKEQKNSPKESYYLGVFNKVYIQNYLQNAWAISQDESNEVYKSMISG